MGIAQDGRKNGMTYVRTTEHDEVVTIEEWADGTFAVYLDDQRIATTSGQSTAYRLAENL